MCSIINCTPQSMPLKRAKFSWVLPFACILELSGESSAAPGRKEMQPCNGTTWKKVTSEPSAASLDATIHSQF